MPELPEVETTCRGISPHITGEKIIDVTIRHTQLRWPIQQDLDQILIQKTLCQVSRRAKYLLFTFDHGTLIIHLGMSGSLRILSTPIPAAKKHDHFEISFDNGEILRFTDPRRFGAILWTEAAILEHTLIANLGPEPLAEDFHPTLLFEQSRGRRCNIKSFIMNGKIVVGVGNIYANEALFSAKIHPEMRAGALTKKQSIALTQIIKIVLAKAIKAGGTTLKDFTKSDGKPGYFRQQLNVYGRHKSPCPLCQTPISMMQLNQRATYFCTRCQQK